MRLNINGAAAASGDGVVANMEEVCERLVRYWDAERGDGRRAPEALAARQASVLVPLVSSSSSVVAAGRTTTLTTTMEGGCANNNNNPNQSGGGGGVHVLLCTRSAKLSSHAGEVCLPGGKNDPGEDDRTAALREAHEEVGLPPGDVEVLAQLPPFLSKGHVSVRPVVARLPDDFSPTLNTDEVDNWFCCPLESFLSKDDGYSYRDWEFVEGKHIRVHFFQRGCHQVWGLTAVILVKTAEIAFGRPPEFDMKPPVPGGTDIQHIKSDGTETERSLSTIERPEPGSGSGSASGPRGGGRRSAGAELPSSRM